MERLFIVFVTFLTIVSFRFSCRANTDSLLTVLNNTLDQQQSIIEKKNERIQTLINNLENDALTKAETFEIYQQLYEEYDSYQYDSAFRYAVFQQKLAEELGDNAKKALAKLNITFVLRSSGMYKEAFDSLYTIQSNQLPAEIALYYYEQMATIYFDLSTYNRDDHYSDINLNLCHVYIDSALQQCNERDIPYYRLLGLKAYANANNKDIGAIQLFETFLSQFDLDEHQIAMAAYEMGKIYQAIGNEQKYLEMIIRSAIGDLRSCTKETMATLELAKYMYNIGEIELASLYIRQAARDAEFYGANHRKVMVSSVLPVIENAMVTSAQYESKRLMNLLLVIVLISFLVIFSTVIIYMQNGKLKIAKKDLSDAYVQQQELNEKLQEANIIKERYVGYSFAKDSDYLFKMDKFKQAIERGLSDKEFEQIRYELKQFDTAKEKEGLYKKFDEVFLKLFPNFVETFNSFFDKNDQYIINDGQPLPTEIRIFALIRIGITEHEQIAGILGYSVRTIYNYKNKIKGMSVLPNDLFESEVMKIKTYE